MGLCLLAWDVFGAVITTASFFGDQPSRGDVIESGMVLVTFAVPVVMLCAVGALAGSRLGLLLLVLPACLLVPMGLDLLGRTRDPAASDPGRSVRLADAVTGLTIPNWLVTVCRGARPRGRGRSASSRPAVTDVSARSWRRA